MKNSLKIVSMIIGSIFMIFSACGNDWDGEITVTGGTKLPYWVSWVQDQDSYTFDGIDLIKVTPPHIYVNENLIRVKNYSSFLDVLTLKCNCTKPCNHDYINIEEIEIEKLLEKYNQNFFETKNLIIIGLTGGAITMNFKVGINEKGVINITETLKRTFGAINDIAIYILAAIEIDSSFITPSSMSVSYKTINN